jgi:hypothetical protein
MFVRPPGASCRARRALGVPEYIFDSRHVLSMYVCSVPVNIPFFSFFFFFLFLFFMAAAMCMLSQLTPSTDQACGVVMSDVLSMHSGVAKLLSARTGHQAQLIHAALGGVGSSK